MTSPADGTDDDGGADGLMATQDIFASLDKLTKELHQLEWFDAAPLRHSTSNAATTIPFYRTPAFPYPNAEERAELASGALP